LELARLCSVLLQGRELGNHSSCPAINIIGCDNLAHADHAPPFLLGRHFDGKLDRVCGAQLGTEVEVIDFGIRFLSAEGKQEHRLPKPSQGLNRYGG
jgi:hypothetical protein